MLSFIEKYVFLCNSCASSKETISWEDGNEYPLVKLDISHRSHPFFTGKIQFVDTAGRIDKFKTKYGKWDKKKKDAPSEGVPVDEAPKADDAAAE